MFRERASYDPVRSSQQTQRRVPDYLQGVESVIKNRIEVDKEITRIRKSKNPHAALKEPEIYAGSPPARSHYTMPTPNSGSSQPLRPGKPYHYHHLQ
jgi:hypothetical protein